MKHKNERRKRIRELGIIIGNMEPGKYNAITDVPGVLVGHYTLNKPSKGVVTGVTAILPHGENLFRRKVRAGVHIINGFGKSMGLMQIAEVGTIETPIIITSTLQSGMAFDTVVRYMLDYTQEICETEGTVNPIVLECSDMYLNSSRSMPLKPEHVLKAIISAKTGPIDEGCVGAGTGMRCLGFKSGVGSASRTIRIDSECYTLGIITVPNFGHTKGEKLLIKGVEIPSPDEKYFPDVADSIIVVVATDAPVDARQLRRIAVRAQVGIARVGSVITNRSGDIVLSFSTSDKEPFKEEWKLNYLFAACAEATEEAILNSIFCAVTTHGRKGRVSHAIDHKEVLKLLRNAPN